MEEIWKDIKGYEGKYQVSNLGNVKSLARFQQNHSKLQKVKERILSQDSTGKECYNEKFRKIVHLCKDGKVKNFYVSRLVAEAFLPNPDNLPEVNHKDCNVENNQVENLEWCDKDYNNNYWITKEHQRNAALKHSAENSTRMKNNNPMKNPEIAKKVSDALKGKISKLRKPVICVETGVVYESLSNAKKTTGLNNIHAAINGVQNTCGGYHWKYLN